MKTIPDRFGNFIKLTVNNWRVNKKRTLTVPDINQMLNKQKLPGDIERNKTKFFGPFAKCPENVTPTWSGG